MIPGAGVAVEDGGVKLVIAGIVLLRTGTVVIGGRVEDAGVVDGCGAEVLCGGVLLGGCGARVAGGGVGLGAAGTINRYA